MSARHDIAAMIDRAAARLGVFRDDLLREPEFHAERKRIVCHIREKYRITKRGKISRGGPGVPPGRDTSARLTGMPRYNVRVALDERRAVGQRERANAEKITDEEAARRVAAAREYKRRTCGGYLGSTPLPD